MAVSLLLIFIASQLFWFRCAGRLAGRWTTSVPKQRLAQLGLLIAYTLVFAYNLPWVERSTPTQLTARAVLLDAPFRWWIFGSVLAFVILTLFSFLDQLRRASVWVYRKLTTLNASDALSLASPSRRTFLQQTATVACAAPFVAGTYGLFYGRLNLEITHKRIGLARCPKAFEGLTIVQLSDIHIGPFMTSQEVGRYVEIANRLQADLVMLTGDFVTWDPSTQESVVAALANLKAPLGVFGCLGNHEIYTRTENSITRLFAARGIHILRQQRAPIVVQGEVLNLIGVDFQSSRFHSRGRARVQYLKGIEPLIQADTTNVLLSHNPNSFERAAELGIDLSLAGHTHGGQVTLEFIHPSLCPSRLITPYVKGWFERNGSQLYVNRGIGTIGVPMRLGARPEITVFELTRSS